jgi:hypothetical protein
MTSATPWLQELQVTAEAPRRTFLKTGGASSAAWPTRS